MLEQPAAPAPRKRGPKTPEGKARSRMNALKHGLRARAFGLLPEESSAEWQQHLADLRAGYGAEDAAEEKLVTAIAVAMWKEIRADRVEVEAMAEIPPVRSGRSHGTDLQNARHAASLTTAIRYQTGAGMAVQRAQRAFLAHRKAKCCGLIAAEVAGSNADGPPPEPLVAANENCTNEFPDTPGASPPLELGHVVPGAVSDATPMDDEAWLETVPVVEADPADEAERRRLLLAVEHKGVRDMIKRAPLRGIEQYSVGGDPVAYEEWFARQPKPPRQPATRLTEEDRAAVAWVTRDNPPWIRGQYLSYYRPPVPADLFLPGAKGEDELEAPAHEPPPAAVSQNPLAELRTRIARLLDRTATRQAEELDLAEAICALKWPNWPAYAGAIDLGLLRLALREFHLTAATVNWLGGHELAAACRAANGSIPAGPRAFPCPGKPPI